MAKDVRVIVKRLQGVSKRTGSKYDFFAYSGAEVDGTKCEFKFTKTCKNYPQEEGTFILHIPDGGISKDKSSIYERFWIRDLDSYEVFDDFKDVDDDDLPF